MRRAENELDGQKDKRGIRRGLYKIGGLSERRIRELKAVARTKLAKGVLDNEGLAAEIRNLALKKAPKARVQMTLNRPSPPPVLPASVTAG